MTVAAVITGGGGLMGRAIARRLAARGDRILLADISERRLATAAEELRASGAECHAHRSDVTDRAGAVETVEAALTALGAVDVLVNVVGGYRGALFESVLDITVERFEDVLRRNLAATFHMTQLLGRHMRDRGGGAIVNLSSVAKDGEPGQADYAAAKAGVVAFTRACARELAPGIRVNAVAPGVIATSVLERLSEQDRAGLRERIPLGGFGAPRDVGDAVAWLTSDESRYVTGEVIHVAGGWGV